MNVLSKRAGALTVAAALWGCSSTDAGSTARRSGESEAAAREPRGEPMPHETCVAGTNAEPMDVNNDGQPDIRTVMEGGRPRCRETDANFDGRIDIYRWFDASGAVTRVEDDYDFDGRVDVVAFFEGGVVTRDILDTNFDGRTDTWREYRNGRVAELRRDSDGDARVDTWERFDANGRVVYAATDGNRDGTPDEDADAGVATAGDAGAALATTPAAPAPAAPTTPAAPATTTPTPAAPGPSTAAPAAPAAPAPAPRQKTEGGAR